METGWGWGWGWGCGWGWGWNGVGPRHEKSFTSKTEGNTTCVCHIKKVFKSQKEKFPYNF